MSGIVGIINLDGASVDRTLLQRMTQFMTYRGPDAQQVWCEDNVGFGHTMLRTTFEAESERQPLSLDGQVWLTADARVDGRHELIGKLAAKGRVAKDANDAELILHAYHVWGEDCLSHLIGDFAFAIWDGRQSKLFCARDHFGVKPFDYAQIGDLLVFSNTLNCIRQHPAVSSELNEQAIGDFLLSGANLEISTTAFADISRLPAAHVLTYQAGVVQTRCYWQLTADNETRYARASDYVEHFKELLHESVADRLRARNVGVLMSGGLDSTTIAAAARELALKDSADLTLRAYTIVYDWLIPDQERYYSRLAADALGLPLSYLVVDDYQMYKDWNTPKLRRPEPSNQTLLAINADHFEQVAGDNRVAVTGWEGDGLFREAPRRYFEGLWRRGRFGRLSVDLWRYLRTQGRVPAIGLRPAIKSFLGKSVPPEASTFPRWLNEDFCAQLNLRDRWEQMNQNGKLGHPRRPTAFLIYSPRIWTGFFESYDPGTTGFPLEVRHPLFDLRLMSYMLSLPPVPWCVEKQLVRMATRGVLPEAVRLRPKTPLAGDNDVELLRRPESEWIDNFEPTPRLAKYVNRALIPRLVGESDANKVGINTRPLSLNFWLECLT